MKHCIYNTTGVLETGFSVATSKIICPQTLVVVAQNYGTFDSGILLGFNLVFK